MRKTKYIVLIFAVLALLLIIPNVSNAVEYTYSDTDQGIEWGYELDADDNVINLECKTKTKSGAVTIPSSIEGKTVISLKGGYNAGAFEECIGITSVTIPNTITKISEYAFENCKALSTLTLHDNIIEIQSYAFSGCVGLTNITIPNNVVSIGSHAFSGCTGLTKIAIPDNVTTIGKGAFKGCSGLKEVTFSEKITKIETETFKDCTGLTSIILPDSVTTINGEYYWEGAFNGCTKLEKILIPDSVASIGKGAFEGCDKLTIYGSDGMASKQYAEENSINFKYISQWDDSNIGDDITPPQVESISVPHSSVSSYYDSNSTTYIIPVNKVLIINVNFSEPITATTTPTLTIKFGNGKNIELTNGAISGSTVAYTYTINSKDIGIMAVVSLAGGDVIDAAGNKAKLSSPELKVELWNHAIYANGTAVDVEEGNNNNNNNNNVSVTGVTLDKSTLSMKVNETYTLKATVAPTNATNKNVTWKSSDEKIAKVSLSGVVTAVAEGKATITVTTADGSKTATCEVTVTKASEDKTTTVAVTGVKLDKTTLSLKVNKTYTLKATVAPTDASNKNVTWKSSNEKVAKVSSSGVVTAVAEGKATITVTTKDGSKTATCEVTVIKDTTISPEKIPQTGIKNGLIFTFVALIGIGVIAFVKYNKLKGI